ncbi:Clp protease N-terminal domain-containing protein [Streptomyces sp. NPDC001833]|uniref:Clp protease N-terminal domain-containing protein n=1 Tax=Streptomyces sp. NPDC001833 TaxID=3154658 RepID=UPI0033220642
MVEDHVEHFRTHGSSWTDIGAALGVTGQAVQQRFNSPHKRHSPETMTDELRRAMAHVEQAAVQHRDNHTGTEHLLWGLTAEDNSATRLVHAAGVPPEAVHRSAGNRLSMGGSQAAERVAWTPCSRKAIAIARTRSEPQRLRPHRLRRPADRSCPARPRSGRRRPDRGRVRPGRPRHHTHGHPFITARLTRTHRTDSRGPSTSRSAAPHMLELPTPLKAMSHMASWR